jgi:lipoate-protein ligase A
VEAVDRREEDQEECNDGHWKERRREVGGSAKYLRDSVFTIHVYTIRTDIKKVDRKQSRRAGKDKRRAGPQVPTTGNHDIKDRPRSDHTDCQR